MIPSRVGFEFADRDLMQRVVLGLEGIEPVLLVGQKAEEPLVGKFGDEEVADAQRGGYLRTAHEGAAEHLLHMEEGSVGIDQEVAVIVRFAR